MENRTDFVLDFKILTLSKQYVPNMNNKRKHGNNGSVLGIAVLLSCARRLSYDASQIASEAHCLYRLRSIYFPLEKSLRLELLPLRID